MDDALRLRPIAFSEFEGWADDDHASALAAFLASCRATPVAEKIRAAALSFDTPIDKRAARDFFEQHFVPHAIEDRAPGLVTGYYEPLVFGARTRESRFTVPVYGRPPDLITTAPESDRARFNDRITGFRNTAEGRVPYFTRAEIEDGAVSGQNLEILYLDDWIALFYMQVQGSGLVKLKDGSMLRLTYDGKNGYPYTSIGRVLIERGEMAPDDIDMDKVKAWLRADLARGRALLQENRSYVFFRELSDEEGRNGPLGAEGVTLTPGRSFAVDTRFHRLGTPIFVTASDLETEGRPFNRLMIGQDAGSAISGTQRGDIFWGTGDEAGARAGRTRHRARFWVFLPKP